jgi:hypothetical protein
MNTTQDAVTPGDANTPPRCYHPRLIATHRMDTKGARV